MSPHLARPLLHTAHLLTFVVLFASGLLLFVPGLRAAVTGGYSLMIRETHRWGGVAYVVLPSALLLHFGARTALAPPARRTVRAWWQGVHLLVTVTVGVVFVLTGFVLWGKRLVPDAIVDGSRAAHDWLTYAVALLLAVHLVEVGLAALAARFTAAASAVGQSEMETKGG